MFVGRKVVSKCSEEEVERMLGGINGIHECDSLWIILLFRAPCARQSYF